MPIYEYVCQSCTHRFEVKQRISDAPIAACERCGQPVVKVISPPAIMFKGSGWYVTDSRPAASTSETSSTSSTTSTSSTSTSTNGSSQTSKAAEKAA